MKEETGWIKYYHNTDHWLWKASKVKTKYEAWLDILSEVNWKDSKVNIGSKLIDCKRGQSLLSLDSWAKRWSWKKTAVFDFFKLLESDAMITKENLVKTVRITVCKYDDYQSVPNATRTQPERNPNATRTQPEPIEDSIDNKDNKDYTDIKDINTCENSFSLPPQNLNPVESLKTETREEKKVAAKKRFTQPENSEVLNYFTSQAGAWDQRTCELGTMKFISHYQANGWMVGRNKMQDWKAAVRGWVSRDNGFANPAPKTSNTQIIPPNRVPTKL